MTLADKIEALTGPELFDWTGNPFWARWGGEHYDGNWVPDCNGKLDYDPGFMHFCCRVYRDGDWVASLYLGDQAIVQTDVMKAGSVEAARKCVEAWCDEQAQAWAKVIAAALRAKEASNG